MKVKDKEKLNNPLKGWKIPNAISSMVLHTVHWPLSTYVALHNLNVTTESVNLDLECNRIVLDMYWPLPGCMALPRNELWKHGVDEAAADRSQGPHSVILHYSCIFLVSLSLLSAGQGMHQIRTALPAPIETISPTHCTSLHTALCTLNCTL